MIDNLGVHVTETSETWGPKGRFGIVPLANNKIYWFACISGPQNNSAFRDYTITDITNHFKDYHYPIPTIQAHSRDEDLIWNDIIDLKPVSRFAFKNVVLIGDAAHATTPNMGQGACQAIEDAIILADEIKKSSNVSDAFQSFEKRRIRCTHFITDTSWRIGKMAQMNNPLLAAIRNFLLRLLPASINEKQLEKLYQVDF